MEGLAKVRSETRDFGPPSTEAVEKRESWSLLG